MADSSRKKKETGLGLSVKKDENSEEGNHEVIMTMTMGTAKTQNRYSRVKTSVWWDMEDCPVPKGLDANGIVQNISSALVKMNYCVPVSIFAYGDTQRIPNHIQHAFNSAGIALDHVSVGSTKMFVDMMFWAIDNPAQNIMLISGDKDFSYALHRLRMIGHNILLAQPHQTSAADLICAANTVWTWISLANGGCPLTQAEITELVRSDIHGQSFKFFNGC